MSLPETQRFRSCADCPPEGNVWELKRVLSIHEKGGEDIVVGEPYYACVECGFHVTTNATVMETQALIESKYNIRRKIDNILDKLLLLVSLRDELRAKNNPNRHVRSDRQGLRKERHRGK
jgi:hypothetical protein